MLRMPRNLRASPPNIHSHMCPALVLMSLRPRLHCVHLLVIPVTTLHLSPFPLHQLGKRQPSPQSWPVSYSKTQNEVSAQLLTFRRVCCNCSQTLFTLSEDNIQVFQAGRWVEGKYKSVSIGVIPREWALCPGWCLRPNTRKEKNNRSLHRNLMGGLNPSSSKALGGNKPSRTLYPTWCSGGSS